MSVLEKCLSYRDANKGSKEGKRPTLGVRFIEVPYKRESTDCTPRRTNAQTFKQVPYVKKNYH